MGIAGDVILIVVAGFVAGLAAHKLRQPPILGYILAGIAVGPYTGGATVVEVKQIELLAEIGVALLLFTIGIELSLKELKPIWKIAVIGAPIQVVLTLAGGYGLGRLLGWDGSSALWFGAAITSSSSAVIMKTLASQGRTGTLSCRVMIGFSVVQDLACVPMMILLPQMGKPGFSGAVVGVSLLKAAAFLALMFVIGMRLIPWLLKRAAAWNSRELFLLLVTALGLGIGYLTNLFGLSFAFGAFMAGLVISESDYGNHALSCILPLRDLFGLLFFVSVGMLLDPAFLRDHAGMILLLTALVGLGKGALCAGLTRLFGYRNIIPLAAGLTLFQISEFSFVLARLGLGAGGIAPDVYGFILSATVLSMVLTPVVSRPTATLYAWWRDRRKVAEPLQTINLPARGLSDHAIIAGGGRIGQHVATVLGGVRLPSVIIEPNHLAFEEARAAGLTVIYGDASEELSLRAAAAERAKVLIITVPSVVTARGILETARKLNPELAVITHAENDEQMQELGGYENVDVVMPEFEAGLEITRQALLDFRMNAGRVQSYLDEVRRNLYAPLRDVCPESEEQRMLRQLRRARNLLELSWQEVAPDSPVCGKTLAESNLRARTGAIAVGVLRGDDFRTNPGPGEVLLPGDVLAMAGTVEQREALGALLMPEPADGGTPRADTGDSVRILPERQ